jgi:DNA polymerase III subunit delta
MSRDPSPSTCLIFEGDKIDQRKRVFRRDEKTGNFGRVQATFMRTSWALSSGKKPHPSVKRWSPQALELLVYLVGNNLQETGGGEWKRSPPSSEREKQ